MTKSLEALLIILILAVIVGVGILIQKAPPPVASSCVITNRGLTLIHTDAEGKKTMWREEK
jgi:hypothetical protein